MPSKFSRAKPSAVHPLMTRGAGRALPVLLHLLADGRPLAGRPGFLEGRHVGRRRRRGRAEDVVEEVLAPDHRRRPRRVRRHGQDARVAEQSGPPRVGHPHAPEVRPVDVGDPVEPREPLVQVRVVGRQQLDEGPVVAYLMLEEQLGLAAERLAQVVVELGVRARVGVDGPQVPDEQPLPAEVPGQRRRPRVGEHAAHLRGEHAGLAEGAGLGRLEQLVVGDAAPEEERQPRRQLEVADGVDAARDRRSPGRARRGTGTAATPAAGPTPPGRRARSRPRHGRRRRTPSACRRRRR